MPFLSKESSDFLSDRRKLCSSSGGLNREPLDLHFSCNKYKHMNKVRWLRVYTNLLDGNLGWYKGYLYSSPV